MSDHEMLSLLAWMVSRGFAVGASIKETPRKFPIASQTLSVSTVHGILHVQKSIAKPAHLFYNWIT